MVHRPIFYKGETAKMAYNISNIREIMSVLRYIALFLLFLIFRNISRINIRIGLIQHGQALVTLQIEA